MPHICMDEVMVFMMALPWVGVGLRWIRAAIITRINSRRG